MHNTTTTVPPPLEPLATIAIVAPSGVVREPELFRQGVGILHELGFATRFPRDLWPGCDYLSDSDENRLSEFARMWHDREVDAIMAARGGYGCLRLADGFKRLPLAETPKRMVGFSDITILHNSLLADHGLVSFHGPVVTSLPRLDKKSIESFRETLCSDMKNWSESFPVEVLQGGGDVSGQLTGGNLSSIVSTLGTGHVPDWKGKIIVLEDTTEPAYKIDKMLTQLHMAGVLDAVRGVLLGDFAEGLDLDTNGRRSHNELVWKRLLELVDDATPVWGAFPAGHGSSNVTLPFGLPVVMNSSSRTLHRR